MKYQHPCVMRMVAWTTDGPLSALMACTSCSKTSSVKADYKAKKIPAGFTTGSWAKFLAKGEERLHA